MFSFLVGGMLPLPRHASRGALLLGRAAVPPRLVGPWLCASGTAEAAAPTCPLPDGILVVHKPQNWTSFDVVAKVRNTLQDHLRGHGHKFTGRKKLKVGHGGTLDPMATGLLVIGVGKGCRALEGYLKGAKSYAAVAQLGSETDSQVYRPPLLTLAPELEPEPGPDPNPGPNPSPDPSSEPEPGPTPDLQDAEGSVIKHAPYEHVTEDALREAAVALTGEILQRNPSPKPASPSPSPNTDSNPNLDLDPDPNQGDILQRPPIFSAIKRDGKRMYDLARKGEVTEEEMVPRKVTIHPELYHASTVHAPCMHRACTVHTPCIYRAYSMYRAYIMHTPCMYHAYAVLIWDGAAQGDGA